MNRAMGWLLATFILLGTVGVLLFNLEGTRGKPAAQSSNAQAAPNTHAVNEVPAAASAPTTTAPFREYSIGDEVVREAEHLEIAPVFFPAVPMDGMPVPSGDDALHVEADVRATANNPNGFALGQFIPYLKIRYEIKPAAGGESIQGNMAPMVARDGLHYGTTVVLPGPGKYHLTYFVEPPSSGGLGRHDDPITGVAGWWKPFQVEWEWDYNRPQAAAAPR